MKANELMIGDWILYGEKPVQVLQLTEGKIYRGFAPIPLTPEILEKNGFQDSEFFGELLYKDWQIISDCHHLAARGGDGWNFDIPCRFVHELQHALRLLGVEKEIVL